MQKQAKNVENKFINLNLNLKNEIINYLPFEQQVTNLTNIHKRFHFALNKKKNFTFLKKEINNMKKEINFSVKNIYSLKSYLFSIFDNEETIDDLINFILKLKYKKDTQLDLTELKNIESKYLANFLTENSKLNYLFLFENKFGKNAEDSKNLFLSLLENTSITELYISQNKIGKYSTDTIFINFLLIFNQNLISLDLSYNRIGFHIDDTKHLANALRFNEKLKILNLSANKIGFNKEDFICLCTALIENSSVETIDLSFNCIENSDENVDMFIDLLKINKRIKYFSIFKNPLTKNEKLQKYKQSFMDSRMIF